MIEGMIGTLKEVNEMKKLSNDVVPEFSKKISTEINSFKEADKPLNDSKERKMHLPSEVGEDGEINGRWVGEKGDSIWEPNLEKIPQQKNPENKEWKEVLQEQGIKGINFKEGEPDFAEISRRTVEIDDFTKVRDKNFKQADIKEAERRGCLPRDVREWRKENNHTWHETNDCKTMQKVPSIIHNNIPHSGGISEIKKKEGN